MIYKYNKLVRDKIPQNIEKKGKKCSYYVLEENEYQKELDIKLFEEANEFIADHSIEEMADLMEVIEAIKKSHNLQNEEIENVRLEKKAKKGGFDEKIYLIEVEETNNEVEDNNIENKQQVLWDNLQETNSLREVQKYIESMNEVRGFNDETIQERMLLLTEEIGELAKSIRKTSKNMYTDINKEYNYDTIESEVADCFYVLLSVASYLNIDVFQSLKDKEKENINRVWKKN